MVDDVCSYTGSQNLYICDLAEWGVIIDDASVTKQMIEHYWTPMWNASYAEGEDCDVQQVIDGLDINRDGARTPFKEMKKVQATCRMVNAGTVDDDNKTPVCISWSSDPDSYEVIRILSTRKRVEQKK